MGRPRGTIRKIADETGLDQATVRRALAASNLTERDCEADFSTAIETVAAIADADRIIGHASNGRGGGGGNSSDYAAARAESERHRAEKLRLQNEKLAGSLIDRQVVTDTGIRILAEARTAFLSLGLRVADRLVGKTDAREIARAIEAEARIVLGELADDEKFFEALDIEALT
ncbi:hypothetical protein [Bradyrhizobium sp. CCBAU 11357]|uniref:hypothetical protein n=1 Tax=Bradyrhizobium sp. CCBAU 11357 TaxID=1630808 RepID=UPI002304312C|nr:hypothetical protein [Bradyrhizobium sp. CCBAU 11357]MDA9498436.1 hypothetical protein [Bradyrhizobium sp. CCBAU 11357]